MSSLLVAAQLMLAVVFAAAAYSKIRSRADLHDFAESLIGLGYVPAQSAPVLARAVVAAELTCVVLLALPATATIGFACAAALSAVFTAAVAGAVARGADAGCRCFGASSGTFRPDHVWRNAFLLVVAALAGWASLSWEPAAAFTTGQIIPFATAAFALSLGAAVATAIVRWDDFTYIIKPSGES